jgi:hypothetical protein
MFGNLLENELGNTFKYLTMSWKISSKLTYQCFNFFLSLLKEWGPNLIEKKFEGGWNWKKKSNFLNYFKWNK